MKKIICILILLSCSLIPLIGCSSESAEYQYLYYPNNTTLSTVEAQQLFIQVIAELSVKDKVTIQTFGIEGQLKKQVFTLLQGGQMELLIENDPINVKVFREGLGENRTVIHSETTYEGTTNFNYEGIDYTKIDYKDKKTTYTKANESFQKKETSVRFGTLNGNTYQPEILSSTQEDMTYMAFFETIANYSDNLIFPKIYSGAFPELSSLSPAFFSGTMSKLGGTLELNNHKLPCQAGITYYDISLSVSKGVISFLEYRSYSYDSLGLTRVDYSASLQISYGAMWTNQYSSV